MADTYGSSEDTTKLLESALSTAFSPIDVPRATINASHEAAESTSTVSEVDTDAPSSSLSKEDEEKWKSEYEGYVSSWKAESAIAREKAEQTRASWEERRAAERTERGGSSGSSVSSADLEEFPPLGPPNPHFPRHGYPTTPSPADVRDSVSGEPSGHKHSVAPHSELHHSTGNTDDDDSPQGTTNMDQSQHWEEVEDVPSMQSSYPSYSYPEQSESASPDLEHTSKKHSEKHQLSEKGQRASDKATTSDGVQVAQPPSASLSVFDKRLSTRSRTLALISSLTINLVLPFINGVMLGFGEIFARNLLGRWGWKVPGGTSTAVGVRSVPSEKKR